MNSTLRNILFTIIVAAGVGGIIEWKDIRDFRKEIADLSQRVGDMDRHVNKRLDDHDKKLNEVRLLMIARHLDRGDAGGTD